jgi:hypothetical protein
MLAQVGGGAQEFDGARATLQEMIERFGGSPASGGDKFRRSLALGAAVRHHGQDHRVHISNVAIGGTGGGFHHFVRDKLIEVVFGQRDVFGRQGYGPFVRRGFEIPLRGGEAFAVGNDGVAGLFQILDAHFAIGLRERLGEDARRDTDGNAEQQDCFSHRWFPSRSYAGEIVEFEVTVAKERGALASALYVWRSLQQFLTASPSPVVHWLGLEWRVVRAAMDAFRETGKLLIVLGMVMAGVGALLLFSGKLPFRLGRLPGDIAYQGRNGSCYFPVVTCILLSVVLSLLLWVVNHFRR